jgi:uncharacterized phiE125 gp8 family phage protein
MALTIVTPPASLAALMLDSIVDHLNAAIDTGESPSPAVSDIGYIEALTEAAVAMVDGPNGSLGRCLLQQVWKQTIDHGFPAIIELTLPPLQSVDSIKYYDDDGALQTLSSSLYRVTGLDSWLAEIAPAYGETWPTVRNQLATIEITFTAGYGDELADVPSAIVHAIRQLVAHWYLNRSAVERTQFAEIPFGVRSLLAPYRIFRCAQP